MKHTGYITVDCDGLELNTASSQTKTGIYARAKAAISTGKPAYAVNCKMNSGVCSPVSVAAWEENATTIIATGHVFRVTITNEDAVTVTNLVTANRTLAAGKSK